MYNIHLTIMDYCIMTMMLRVHDDIIVIVAEEEERVTVKISKQAESPMCTKNRMCELNRVLHL